MASLKLKLKKLIYFLEWRFIRPFVLCSIEDEVIRINLVLGRQEVITAVVLKGSVFSDKKRTTEEIEDEARRRGLTFMSLSVVRLVSKWIIYHHFKNFGLDWVVCMHMPLIAPDHSGNGDPGRYLLRAHQGDQIALDIAWPRPGGEQSWSSGGGFMFLEV